MNSFISSMNESPLGMDHDEMVKIRQQRGLPELPDDLRYGKVKPEKHALKVTFDDGDYLYTTINASRDEAYAYYMGKPFEKADETSHTVTKIEFLDDGDDEPEPYSRHRASAALYH